MLRYDTGRAIWPKNTCQNLHPSISGETPGISLSYNGAKKVAILVPKILEAMLVTVFLADGGSLV